MPFPYYEIYGPSVPRKAKGGIKAQSKLGRRGRSWWASRWMAVLEDFRIGARLSRGRSYARRGQVLSIDVAGGVVKAQVQGSRAEPYEVEIGVRQLRGSDWEKLAEELSRRPAFAAQLLSGRMPEDIEDAFWDAGLSLFPDDDDDLETDCSCPDWSNPCKHVAAVYLLLGEEFERDPFLIFKLRGVDREELLGLAGRDAPGAKAEALLSPPESLPIDPADFWGQDDAQREPVAHGAVRVPAVSASLPKRLGSFPFWRGEDNFIPALEEMYRRASHVGLEVFLAEGRDRGN